MHVRRQSDEEPPVIRRKVTSEMVAARNRAADELLAQIRGEKAKLQQSKTVTTMPRGGPQPNAGRKPVANSQTICWTLVQSRIELVKAEGERQCST